MAATTVINRQALIETGLFQSWSPSTFNELKSISASEKVPLDTVVESIGKDLRDAGLSELIGISRTHNHFKLRPGDVMQVTLGSSIDDPAVTVESGATVAHLNPVKLESMSIIPIPYMWAYDKASKKFFPVQFFDGSNRIMQQRFSELCVGEKRIKLVSFLDQFISHVERTGTQDDLGFYIRYDDLMKLDNGGRQGITIMEETDINNQRQWMIPMTQEMMEVYLIDKRKTEPHCKISSSHWFFPGSKMENELTSIGCRHCCCH